MLYGYHFRMLNELNVRIDTKDVQIPFEWFHVVRSDDFCNTKWHTHPSVEMHCVLNGMEEFSFENETIRIHENQCLLIPPKYSHRRSHLQESSMLKYSLNFSIVPRTDAPEAAFLKAAFQSSTHRLFPFPSEAAAAMEVCLREANIRKSGFLSIIQSQLPCALYSFARELCAYPEADYTITTRRVLNDERYQLIEKFILNNMSSQLTVQGVADYMNLSTKQISRIVAASGEYKSISELILARRMERAKKLLDRPELTISEVAQRTGFSTEYYFNRVFKREVGLPPGRYRKSLRGQ